MKALEFITCTFDPCRARVLARSPVSVGNGQPHTVCVSGKQSNNSNTIWINEKCLSSPAAQARWKRSLETPPGWWKGSEGRRSALGWVLPEWNRGQSCSHLRVFSVKAPKKCNQQQQCFNKLWSHKMRHPLGVLVMASTFMLSFRGTYNPGFKWRLQVSAVQLLPVDAIEEGVVDNGSLAPFWGYTAQTVRWIFS